MPQTPSDAKLDGQTSEPAPWSDEDHGLYDLFLENGKYDLDKWHHYFPIYERYFSRFRGKPISILEIGVFRGGSLRLWRRYFGPDAQITGIDIDPACAAERGENIEIYIGDQSEAAFLAKVAAERGPFDIIIDDGGHRTRQQIASLEALTPFIAEGGIYLVEDVHTSLWPEFVDHPLGLSFLDVATRMAEKLTWWHQDRRSFARYATAPYKRPGEMIVPDVARKFFSIAFYDSVVVFERTSVTEPWHERR